MMLQLQDASQVKKVLFCTGKLYFELAERKQKDNRNDVALIRMEQIISFAGKTT